MVAIMTASYQPCPEHRFTFGLWTVGNPGADPFGPCVRESRSPVQLIELLARVGAYGVNFHDNDLVPIDATATQRDAIVAEYKEAMEANGLVTPMATTNLFSDPAFRDGAFTSTDPEVRAYALQKTMSAIDLGVEVGARIFVLWGGREGVETDAAKDPIEAMAWYREGLDYLCEYVRDQGYDMRFALEAKPNEPRSDIYLPTTGACLAFIETLARPDMVGVNPEVAHEQMAGLNFSHAVAQALAADKLFHIDLNDQNWARFDQDLRFGSQNPKASFFLVKLLEDVGYEGSRHFDAHAYRTEDWDGVEDFARGCMRTYLILKEKVRAWNEDAEIREILADARQDRSDAVRHLGVYDSARAASLKAHSFDRVELGGRGRSCERLDQLTMDILYGVR